MKKLLLLPLILFSCSKDAPEPGTSLRSRLQGEWLPASPVTWTFYSEGNAIQEVYRGTTHQYRFKGDSVCVSVVGDGTGRLIASTYALSDNSISVWNDFAHTEVAEFEIVTDGGSMKWTARNIVPVQYTINGKEVQTDSSRVVMEWRKR